MNIGPLTIGSALLGLVIAGCVVQPPPPPLSYAAAMPPPVAQPAPQAAPAPAACREFQQTVTIGGTPQAAYGTTCQQPDGSWKVVDAPQAAPASVPAPQPQVAAVPVYPTYAYPYPYPYPAYTYAPGYYYGGVYFHGRWR
jgi:hypothetical protein